MEAAEQRKKKKNSEKAALQAQHYKYSKAIPSMQPPKNTLNVIAECADKRG